MPSPSSSPFEALLSLERRGIRLELGPLKEIASDLGLFPLKFRAIHVAGTNGKGSVTVMIDHLLRESVFSVGRYTSPHLHDFRERIVVNSKKIEFGALNELSEIVLKSTEKNKVPLTFFEATTLVALLYFKALKVDWVVLEVGMGGRLDATNIVDSELVAIPSIGLDHTEWLGTTEREIAREKCGVLRCGSKLVTGELSIEAEETIYSDVRERGIEWFKYGESFSHVRDKQFQFGEKTFEVTPPLNGKFQASNCAVALASAEIILQNLNSNKIKKAFHDVSWPGRFELIRIEPELWLDVAHNPAGIEALIASLPSETEIDFYYSASRGKDISKMCDLLLARGKLFYLEVQHERLLSYAEFKSNYSSIASKLGGYRKLSDFSFTSLLRPTVVCGSVYMIGEVRKYLNLGWQC